MNTEIIAHPTLQHVGITTPNLDAMLDWYRKVLGMTVNKRVSAPAGRAPFTAVAFCSNDEINFKSNKETAMKWRKKVERALK